MEPSNEIEIVVVKDRPTTLNGQQEIATQVPQTIPSARDELSWKKLSEYETIVLKQSGRISSLQNSACTLANSYFISQAVVFTALSTTNSLVCRDSWFPLFLSVLPGALNLFAFFKIGQEYIETMISQKEYKKLRTKHEVDMWGGPPLIPVLDDETAKDFEEREKERLTRNLHHYMYAFGLLAAVVASGSWWMLCGKSLYAFGLLAAVVASGSLWMLCGKRIIFKLKHKAT